jgi:membrane protease YdiL (CAAX protease family)
MSCLKPEKVGAMLGSIGSSDQTERNWREAWRNVAETCGLIYRPGWINDICFVGAVLAAIVYWIVLSVAGASWPLRGPGGDLIVVLSIVLWQPLFEEIFFRGVLQGILLAETGGRPFYGPLTLANVVASVTFASAHLPTHQLLWVGYIFVVSLALGYLRERLRSLYPPTLLHMYYNGGYLLLTGWSQN